MFGSGVTTLIISNEDVNGVMKIVKSLEKNCLLIKRVSWTIKNEAKEQKRGFLRVLLDTLGSSLLGNLLTGNDTIRARESTFRAGEDTFRAGESTVRVGQVF